jgi:hypothetical protein
LARMTPFRRRSTKITLPELGLFFYFLIIYLRRLQITAPSRRYH